MIRKQRSIAVLFSKKFNLFLLFTFLLAVAVFFGWQWLTLPISTDKNNQKIFVIKKGEDLSTISQHLREEGLIKNTFVFKTLVLSKGLSRSIQSGSFEISPVLSLQGIIDLLVRGPADIWVTFPEGWRKEESSQRLKSSLPNFNEEEFIALAKDLEGYLFPDTYLFPKQSSPSSVIRVFRNNFDKKFTAELEVEAAKKHLDKKQVLILASIVEREAKYDQDRPIIAGILLKRWQKSWPLQVDATVQYAIASSKDWWPTLRKADLGTDSPFNTYKYRGLPPAPICNPGLASIRAVIYPLQTSYWFYLSDKNGLTHYATTVEEHNQNITKYLK